LIEWYSKRQYARDFQRTKYLAVNPRDAPSCAKSLTVHIRYTTYTFNVTYTIKCDIYD